MYVLFCWCFCHTFLILSLFLFLFVCNGVSDCAPFLSVRWGSVALRRKKKKHKRKRGERRKGNTQHRFGTTTTHTQREYTIYVRRCWCHGGQDVVVCGGLCAALDAQNLGLTSHQTPTQHHPTIITRTFVKACCSPINMCVSVCAVVCCCVVIRLSMFVFFFSSSSFFLFCWVVFPVRRSTDARANHHPNITLTHSTVRVCSFEHQSPPQPFFLV